MDYQRMSRAQWVAVFVTVGLNALDGFDVLSISFASPGIAADWQLDSATLGWVLSMELLGMAIGSLVLGPVADRFGRRITILGCLGAMTVGMFGAGFATSIAVLLAWRLLTGLGIGGMLAAINAAAAEFSNLRYRGLAMAFMVIGYPIGGVVGGLAVQQILVDGSWQDVFFLGAWVTAAFIPIVWFFVPETPAFLDRQRRDGALERINGILARFGHVAAERLSSLVDTGQRGTVADILRPALLTTTVLITLAYFTHITSFYFLLKWVPKIVVDMGFEPREAAGFLTWMNVGGATGGAVFGLFTTRFGLRRLTIVTLIGTTGVIAWFGRGSIEVLTLTIVAGGFFANSGIVGLYALLARVFPTHVRATGTGFAIGVGRGGAALAPIMAGYLFQFGFGLQTVALAMGGGSLLAALAVSALRVRETDRQAEPVAGG